MLTAALTDRAEGFGCRRYGDWSYLWSDEAILSGAVQHGRWNGTSPSRLNDAAAMEGLNSA